MTNELAENLIPILLQTCGKEYVVIKDTSVLASYPSKGANYEHRLARYRAYTTM